MYTETITDRHKQAEDYKGIEKMITKPKTLIDQLREMALDVETEVKAKVFKTQVIRKAVSQLRKEGYDFIVTERGCIDSCKVTRVK